MHTTSCSLLLLTLLGPAASGGLQPVLDNLLKALPHDGVRVGACVVSLPDERVVYALNPDRALVPASCQKVVSAGVALDVLGSDYAFETQLKRLGNDLVVIGGGDPALGDPKLAKARDEDPLAVLRRWAETVGSGQAATLSGRLLIDDTAFEPTRTHPSWETGDLPKWFAAPVGALNFNDNCVEFHISPTRRGQPVAYTLFPPNSWIRVKNRCVSGQKSAWIHRDPATAVFELRGQCSKAQQLQPVAVPDPGLFTAEVFRSVLYDRGIAISEVRRATAAELARSGEILSRERTPIDDVLLRALRDSQNLFAECLIKAAAREVSGARTGSWTQAADLVPQRLAEWGVDTSGLVFVDGSGLSRLNRVSARQIVGVLTRVYGHWPSTVGNRFIASLAEAGKSGTLRKRMKSLPGTVYGKTGYLKGVRSLCGFVAPEGDGPWYAFAVVFNGIPGGTAPYNTIHDKVCHVLAESSP